MRLPHRKPDLRDRGSNSAQVVTDGYSRSKGRAGARHKLSPAAIVHDRAVAPLGATTRGRTLPSRRAAARRSTGIPVRLGSEVVLTPFNVLLRHLADALVASSQSGAVLP